MDTFARGLQVASKLIEDRVFDDILDSRYKSFQSGIGQEIVSGKATFQTLEAYALQNLPIRNESGRQEKIKALLNQYILNA